MKDSDVEYYQAHKDDEEEWGRPEKRRPESRRLASVVSVRFAPEEEVLLRREAEARGSSLSNFIRTAALRECRPTARFVELEALLASKTVRDEWSAEGSQTGIVFWVAGEEGEPDETLTMTLGNQQ